MAKKIKLPLDMGNDVKVRTIEELKEHYNAEKVVSYFLDGQLLTWLEERFYEDEAGKIKKISKDSPNISAEIAKAFEIEIQDEVDVEEIEERNERINLLRQFTSDDEILKNVDLVAFSQEDMDIVHTSDIIYLCGDSFRIPYSVEGKTYIGVNSPTVDIKSNEKIELQSKNITVKNCVFSEATLANMKTEEPAVEKSSNSELSIKLGALESEIISSDIEVKKGKTLRFENKEIFVRADIECSGKVEFENCVIHYNEKDNCGIKMQGSGKSLVSIKNCKFIGYGYKCAFISFNDPDKCIISVEDTEFTDCCCFIVDYDGAFEDGEIAFSRCTFKNCLSFVHIEESSGEFNMSDCIIIQNDIPEYYKKATRKKNGNNSYLFDQSPFIRKRQVYLFDLSSCDITSCVKNTAVIISSNFDTNTKKFKIDGLGLNLGIFNGENECAKFVNCHFIGSTPSTYILYNASAIANSYFRNCNHPYYGECGVLEIVEDCIFDNCTDIFDVDDISIERCQFIKCDEIISGCNDRVNIEDCKFINISLKFDDCFNLGVDSEIKNCLFDGIKCDDHYLVYSSNNSNKSSTDIIVVISGCEFHNCTTGNGDGELEDFIHLSNKATIKTLFNEREEWYTAIEIEDCEGLENLDKEGDTAENYTIRYEDENGERIDCDMDIDSIMADFS